jgi:uridine kinase
MTILMLASVSYTQTSNESTGVNRAELVALCEKAAAEVEASRVIIKDYQSTIERLDELIAEQEKERTLSEQQIQLHKLEAKLIRESLSKERLALELKNKEAAELRKALAKATKKKNFFKSIAKITTAVAAVAVGVLVLKQ